MADRDKLDKLLTDLENLATDIQMELSKNSESKDQDADLLVMERTIEDFIGHISSQAYDMRTLRRVLKEGDE